MRTRYEKHKNDFSQIMFDFIITGLVIGSFRVDYKNDLEQRFEPKQVSEALILPFTAVYQYGKIGILKIALPDVHKQSF